MHKYNGTAECAGDWFGDTVTAGDYTTAAHKQHVWSAQFAWRLQVGSLMRHQQIAPGSRST